VLSPNEASYTFVLLLVPIVLLLDDRRRTWSAILIALYVAAELPMQSWDEWLFPKAWLMLALFLFAGWMFLRRLPPSAVGAVILAVVGVSAAATVQNMRTYRAEAAQIMHPAVIESDGIYAGSPTFSGDGWIYEAIGEERYLLRKSTAAGIQTYKFEGDAFHPAASRRGREIAFELVADGRSHIELFNPDTKELRMAAAEALNPREPALSADGTKLAFVAGDSLYLFEHGSYRPLAHGEISNPTFLPDDTAIVFCKGRPGKRSIESTSATGGNVRTLVKSGDCFGPAISPDGRLLAYSRSATGGRHIWIEDLASMTSRQMTFGNCNNESPAWDGDSRSIVFASDCSRGLGLTALYRLSIPSS